eukprot:gene14515-14642_t
MCGVPAVSVQWGAWAGGGMAAGDAQTAARVERMGMRLISPAAGLAALEAAMCTMSQLSSASSSPVIAAVPVLWPEFLQRRLQDLADICMFDHFTGIVDDAAEGTAGTTLQPSGVQLQQPIMSVEAVKSLVQVAVQEVLGSAVGDDQPLMAAGLDSLGTVELRNALESRLGLRLPPTLIFDFPTVVALTEFVGSRIAAAAPRAQQAISGGDESGARSPLQAGTARAGHQLPVQAAPLAAVGNVAIVSVAQRLPGASNSNSLKASDTVNIVPYSYWDSQHAARQAGELQTSFGSFLPAEQVTEFDPAAFSLPVAEASLIDPQQRLLMEAAAEALSGTQAFAAFDGAAVSGKDEGFAAAYRAQCSVFVGVSSRDYFTLGKQYSQGVTSYSATATTLSVVSGRLSFTFGLSGAAVTVDTACSSSLVSTHQAMNCLARQQCSAALAGGVNLTLTPDTPAMFTRAGMLSPEGRCKTLDAAADGYVRAEAVGVMVLELPRRTDDGGDSHQRIVAFLAGSAVNQDGRSSSLTAPNGPAQQSVIRAALADCKVISKDVKALQLHGTGTPLGDPIELQAAAEVFGVLPGMQQSRDKHMQPLAMLSSKSWYGHSEPGAGVVGLMHTMTALKHMAVLPISHLRNLNPMASNILQEATAAVAETTTGPLAAAASDLQDDRQVVYQVQHEVSHPADVVATASQLVEDEGRCMSITTLSDAPSPSATGLFAAWLGVMQSAGSSLSKDQRGFSAQALLPGSATTSATSFACQQANASRAVRGAGVAGLLKALQQESSGWNISIADHPDVPEDSLNFATGAAALDQTVIEASVFGSIATAGVRLMPKLLPAPAQVAPASHKLIASPRGAFSNLVPEPVQLQGLPAGHVGVQVAAVGINFRDVLNVLGMYPGDPGAPGSDVAGLVVQAGPDSSLQPGQAVFGLAVGGPGHCCLLFRTDSGGNAQLLEL